MNCVVFWGRVRVGVRFIDFNKKIRHIPSKNICKIRTGKKEI